MFPAPLPPGVDAEAVLEAVELVATAPPAIAAPWVGADALAGALLNGFMTKMNPDVTASPTSRSTE